MNTEKEYTVDDIHINNGNFLNRQICVPKEMPVHLAEHLLNMKDLCGTTNGWVYNESLGEVECQQDKTKKHLVFGC